jgi:beta-phosphoglucomutase-like phosphatase (HAD superfamily)
MNQTSRNIQFSFFSLLVVWFMIKAIIFDLDGVLVQTEKLKSLAYSKAVQRIRGLREPDFRASDAYQEVIGASREITSTFVMNKLELENDLRPLMTKINVSRPVDALTAIRYEIYYDMVGDPQVIRDNRWPHAIYVLKIAKENSCKTGLATLSKRKDVEHVIEALRIKDMLDVIVTAEDVSKGKPDSEIYLVVAKKLGLDPTECLVLEDSVNGIKSALSAGVNVVAIATPFTKTSILSSHIIESKWIVKEPKNVRKIVQRRISEIDRTKDHNGRKE